MKKAISTCLLTVVLIATIALLISDYRSPRTFTFDFPTPPKHHDYDATLNVAKLVFECKSRTAAGELTLNLRAPVSRRGDIREVALVVWADGEDGQSATVQYYQAGKGLNVVQEADAAKQITASAVHLRAPVSIQGTVVRDENWYPFDEYTLPISIDACAFTKHGDCFEPTVWIQRITAHQGDNFYWRLAGDRFTLTRALFVRTVAVAFVLIGVGLLLFTTGKGELAGYLGAFAAIRAWIALQPIERFPTLLDQAVAAVLLVWTVLIVVRTARK